MTCKNCNPPTTVGPVPYYQQVHDSVLQEHKTVYSQLCHAVGVIAEEEWVIPNTDSEVTLTINDLSRMVVGAYLYNPNYGYFKINSWVPSTGKVGVSYDEVIGTQAPGTTVPAGTSFLVVPKPCCEDDTYTVLPFLAADFTAPAVSSSILVKVTSTFGLQEGDYVRVSFGTYKLVSINTNGFIEILNEGNGITPGTTVIALDTLGNYVNLISRDSPQPCNSTLVTDVGPVVTCGTAGPTLLEGEFVEQNIYLDDPVTHEASYAFSDARKALATKLSAPCSFTTGATSLNFFVDDSTGFKLGDYIQFRGYALFEAFDVTLIVSNISGNNISGLILTGWNVPPVDGTIPEDTAVVKADVRTELTKRSLDLFSDTVIGSTNAIIVSTSKSGILTKASNVNTLPEGITLTILPIFNNTGPVTIEFASPFATPIPVLYLGYPLIGGELAQNVPAKFMFSNVTGSPRWHLLNHSGRWGTWTPTFSTENGNHWVDVVINRALVQRHGRECRIIFSGTGEIITTAPYELRITPPVPSDGGGFIAGHGGYFDGSSTYSEDANWGFVNPDSISLTKGDASLMTLGVVTAQLQGTYVTEL